MNAIREIKKVKNGRVEIELPNNLNGKEVEVIVLLNKSEISTQVAIKKKNQKVWQVYFINMQIRS